MTMWRFIIMFSCFFASCSAYDWDVITPLDEYVQNDDGFFSWEEIASYNYDGVTLYIINMTSQKYQDESFSNHPIWWHTMGIAIPETIKYPDFGILYIGGESNSNPSIPPENELTNVAIAITANYTGVVSGYIKHVPNQPIVFSNDPTQRSRSEDSAIAWSWRTFLDDPDPDPTVILRMPMTKAAKRGLDTIHEVAKWRAPETDIQRFAVTGPSKRGWTAWSLAATDQRVALIVPMVFSMLNMEVTLMSHFMNMDGGWSFAFQPYHAENLTMDFFNPKTQGLFEVEDMYRYRERFTIPILEVLSTGDEFFLCDDSLNWWDDIPSENKYMLMLPNAEHIMAPYYLKIFETGVSFMMLFLEEMPFPKVWWEMFSTSDGYEIIYHADPAPLYITAFSAVTLANDTRRDFRLFAGTPPDLARHPVLWRRNLLIEDLGDGSYRTSAEIVEGEWVGFFIEGEWEGPTGVRMVFTSQVSVIPDTYPREPCTDEDSCYGRLV